MASQGSIWVFGYGSLVWRPNFEYSRSVRGYIKGWRRVWWQGSTDHRGTPERPGRTVTLHEDPHATTWGVAYELAGNPQQQLETLKYLEWREKQYDIRHYVDLHHSDGLGALPPPELGGAGSAASPVARSSDAATPTRGREPGDAGSPRLPSHTPGGDAGHPCRLNLPHDAEQAASTAEALLSAGPSRGSPSSGARPQQGQGQGLGQGHDPVVVAGCLVYIAGPDLSRNVNYLGPASLHDIAQQIAGSHGPSGPNRDYLYGLAAAMREMGVHDEDLFHLEQLVKDISSMPLLAAA